MRQRILLLKDRVAKLEVHTKWAKDRLSQLSEEQIGSLPFSLSRLPGYLGKPVADSARWFLETEALVRQRLKEVDHIARSLVGKKSLESFFQLEEATSTFNNTDCFIGVSSGDLVGVASPTVDDRFIGLVDTFESYAPEQTGQLLIYNPSTGTTTADAETWLQPSKRMIYKIDPTLPDLALNADSLQDGDEVTILLDPEYGDDYSLRVLGATVLGIDYGDPPYFTVGQSTAYRWRFYFYEGNFIVLGVS